MKVKHLFILILFFCGRELSGAKLLDGLDFSDGKWVMVGVSLHNYHPLPIQEQLGTFIVTDNYILKLLQEEWKGEEVFEDYCDFHYSIKFYKDGELQKSLRANLLCNYITVGAFSYQFNQELFTRHKRYFKPIRWSRIRFRDLSLLQQSVDKISKLSDVYWYGDVQQYHFDGSFTLGVDSLRWDTDKDSVVDALTEELRREMGTDEFYLQLRCWYISDDFEWMSIRFNLFCREEFFKKYTRDDWITKWRSHFSIQNFVQLVVIGLNRKEYYRAMGQINQ